MDELSERLSRLGTLRDRARSEFDQDPFLRDIAERNLEVAAQCCIDICNKIISREQARKPADAHDAILGMAELLSRSSVSGLRSVHPVFRPRSPVGSSGLLSPVSGRFIRSSVSGLRSLVGRCRHDCHSNTMAP